MSVGMTDAGKNTRKKQVLTDAQIRSAKILSYLECAASRPLRILRSSGGF
jgi:hypothetical protein